MSQKYREYQHLNLPAMGQEMLAQWQENKAFEKSVSLREGATPFVFMKVHPAPTVCRVFITLLEEL